MRIVLAAVLLLCATVASASTPVRGELAPGLEAFDRVVLDVMARWQIPGAALAVAHQGRLVAARGYGFADVEAKLPVEPGSAFALASLSKTITAVTVLRLVDEEKLALDAKVVDLLAPSGKGEVPVIRDARVREITLRQLLDHSSGFPRDAKRSGCGGPQHLQIAAEMVSCMLGRKLLFAPGTNSEYSNFGYTFAGEIVRVRAGAATFEEAARSLTLDPLDLQDVRAEARAPAYLPGQVVGYSLRGQRKLPGGGPPSRLASGGFVGSPLDMTRFLWALRPDADDGFLSTPARAAMLARPEAALVRANGSWFGLGWDGVRVGPDGLTYAKNGGLSGTATIFEHDARGVDWAIFLGTGAGGDDPDGGPRRAVAEAMRAAVAEVRDWPVVDLWSRFAPDEEEP